MTDVEQLFLDWLAMFERPISMSVAQYAQTHVPAERVEGLLGAWARRGWVRRHPAAIDSAVDGIVDGFTLTFAGFEQARLARA